MTFEWTSLEEHTKCERQRVRDKGLGERIRHPSAWYFSVKLA